MIKLACLLGNKQFNQFITLSYGKIIQIECICLLNEMAKDGYHVYVLLKLLNNQI